MSGGSWAPSGANGDDGWQTVDPLDARQDGVAILWHVLLGLNLAFLGLIGIANILVGLRGGDAGGEVGQAAIWLNSAFLLLLMGLIPLLWVRFTRVGKGPATAEYLNLQWRKLPRGLLEGTGWAVVCLLGVGAIAAAYAALFGEPAMSPIIEDLVASLNWPLVFVIAFSAGVGEEILFRGVLQRWAIAGFARTGLSARAAATLGILAQGIVFGVFHAGYGTVLNFAIPLAIGILFGFLYYWRRNLWIVIAAHFLYDLVLLAAVLLFPEAM